MSRDIIILNLSVCSDPKIVPLFINIMEDLEKQFQSYLPLSLKYFEQNNDVVNNLDQLKEKIINFGANLILIFGPASMQNDITTTIREIADTESRSELFAKISDYLIRPNIQFSNYSIRNKKLIFVTTGSKSKILNDVRLAADAMVLGAHLLRSTTLLQIAKTNKHNIHGLSVIVEENGREEDTKKKTQEKHEILDIPQSKLPSLLKLNLSELSHLPVDKNVSDKTPYFPYRETHQSESSSFAISPSVTSALSLIKQTVTKDHIVPVKTKFVNIERAFSRISSQGKVSVKDALTIIEETVTEHYVIKLGSELVDIEKAFRRISFEDKVSCKDVPQFRVATKRGYAVIVEKKANEIKVKTDESSSSPITLNKPVLFVEKGDRIFLATAVIPEKNVTSYADESGRLIHTTSYRIKYGQNVMFPGSDLEKGQIIINDSKRIFSREVMLLAASGCKDIKVFTKLSIGVMAIRNKSKDEHLYDCNRLILISLLEENNFDFDVLDLGTRDDPEDIIENITTALEHVDLLVTTGCFSDKDYVKNILKNHFDAVFLFESVNMKPGKSTAFASCYFKDKAKIILCLPGNPASVFVTAHLFFLPLVKYIHYIFDEDWPIIKVEVDQTLLLHSRPRYVWANLPWNEEIHCFPKVTCNKECSINNDVSNSNGNVLLMLPPKTFEKSTLEVSSRVQALFVKFSFSTKHTRNIEHLQND